MKYPKLIYLFVVCGYLLLANGCGFLLPNPPLDWNAVITKMYPHGKALVAIEEVCSAKIDNSVCKKLLADVKIEWCNEYFIHSPSTGQAVSACYAGVAVAGHYEYNNTVYVAWRGKFWRSTLGHEILHMLAWKTEKDAVGPDRVDGKWHAMDIEITNKLKDLDL